MKKKEKRKTYKELVHEILIVDKESRDCDIRLYVLVLKKLNWPYNDQNARQLLLAQKHGTIPLVATVARIRSLLQNKFIQLRGDLYEERHTTKQQNVLKDLGYQTSPPDRSTKNFIPLNQRV